MAEGHGGDDLDLTGASYHDIRADPGAVAFYLAHERRGAPAALHRAGTWWPVEVTFARTPDGAILGLRTAAVIGPPVGAEAAAFGAARRILMDEYDHQEG